MKFQTVIKCCKIYLFIVDIEGDIKCTYLKIFYESSHKTNKMFSFTNVSRNRLCNENIL